MSLIPDALQGRINSIIRLMLYGSLPLGLAVAGFLIEHVGAAPTVLLLGAGLVAVALAATLHPRIRNARMPEPETEMSDETLTPAA
jgi:hypothetical protein